MPITDNFNDYTAGLTGPICGAFDIVPDDTADLPRSPVALWSVGPVMSR